MSIRKTALSGTLLVFALGMGILMQPAQADEALTERNKNIVRDFYATVLIGRNVDAAPRFLRSDYIHHNPQVPAGLKGFMDTFRERFAKNLPPDYKRELLNVIGENNVSLFTCDRPGRVATVSTTRHLDSTCSVCRTG